MRIRFSHPDCPDVYELRPYKESTCLELIRNPDNVRTSYIQGRKVVGAADRHPKYPYNLEHGLRLVAEAFYTNSKCTDELVEIDLLMESHRISEYFNEWINKIQIEVEQDD